MPLRGSCDPKAGGVQRHCVKLTETVLSKAMAETITVLQDTAQITHTRHTKKTDENETETDDTNLNI